MGSSNPPPIGSILVVGGCGFLGHHIVERIREVLPAVQLSVLDLRTDQNRFDHVDYHSGDITSAADVTRVLEATKPQILIHTASPTAIRYNPAIFAKVNIDGTQNLLDCAGRAGCVRAFVFTSSASIVHDTHSDLVMADETYPVLEMPPQRSYYGWTKGVAEQRVLAANRQLNGMLTTAVRPCGLLGEGDVQLLPPMLGMYLTGRHYWQLGRNTNLFDMTYVANAAHAHVLAAQALWQTAHMATAPPDHERVEGEAFVVTNDQPMPFWSFVHLIWRAAGWTGSPGDAWVIPRLPGLILGALIEWIVWLVTFGTREAQFKMQAVQYSTMTRTFNIEKAKKRLGYKPLVPLEVGVVRGVDWLLKNSPEMMKALEAKNRKEGKKTEVKTPKTD